MPFVARGRRMSFTGKPEQQRLISAPERRYRRRDAPNTSTVAPDKFESGKSITTRSENYVFEDAAQNSADRHCRTLPGVGSRIPLIPKGSSTIHASNRSRHCPIEGVVSPFLRTRRKMPRPSRACQHKTRRDRDVRLAGCLLSGRVGALGRRLLTSFQAFASSLAAPCSTTLPYLGACRTG